MTEMAGSAPGPISRSHAPWAMLKACNAATNPRPTNSQPTVLALRAAITAPTVAKPGTMNTWGAKYPPPRLRAPSHSQMAATSSTMVRPHRDQASQPMRRDLTGSSFCSFRPSARLRHDRLGTVTDDRQGEHQAANRRRTPCNQPRPADTQRQQTPRSEPPSQHSSWSRDGRACLHTAETTGSTLSYPPDEAEARRPHHARLTSPLLYMASDVVSPGRRRGPIGPPTPQLSRMTCGFSNGTTCGPCWVRARVTRASARASSRRSTSRRRSDVTPGCQFWLSGLRVLCSRTAFSCALSRWAWGPPWCPPG